MSHSTVFNVSFINDTVINTNSTFTGCFPNQTVDIGVILPEVLAIPILTISVSVMYHGVEIAHPVFRLLFNNLIFAFVSSAIILSAAPIVDGRNLLLISEFGNLISLLFHHSTWMVLSCLRFAYIVKSDWLHSKCPDVNRLRNISQIAVALSFSFILSAELSVLLGSIILSGWPKFSLFLNLQKSEKVFIIFSLTSVYLLPISVSLVFYVMLARATSANMSKVGSELPDRIRSKPSDSKNCLDRKLSAEHSSSSSSFGIYVGGSKNLTKVGPAGKTRASSQPQSVRTAVDVGNVKSHQEAQFPDVDELNESEMNVAIFHNSRKLIKAEEEKNSALRSLKTNLIVFAIGVVTTFLVYSFPPEVQQCLNLVSTASLKTLFPVVTTIANFGNVQSVFKIFLTDKLMSVHG